MRSPASKGTGSAWRPPPRGPCSGSDGSDVGQRRLVLAAACVTTASPRTPLSARTRVIMAEPAGQPVGQAQVGQDDALAQPGVVASGVGLQPLLDFGRGLLVAGTDLDDRMVKRRCDGGGHRYLVGLVRPRGLGGQTASAASISVLPCADSSQTSSHGPAGGGWQGGRPCPRPGALRGAAGSPARFGVALAHLQDIWRPEVGTGRGSDPAMAAPGPAGAAIAWWAP
jgi:hypothetical protein